MLCHFLSRSSRQSPIWRQQDETLLLHVNKNFLKPKQQDISQGLGSLLTNNLRDLCRMIFSLCDISRRHCAWSFFGMGLSHRNAIHWLVLPERTSLGISLCDAWLRWAHTWAHTWANTETDTHPQAITEVTRVSMVKLNSSVKLGHERGNVLASVDGSHLAAHIKK